MRVLVKPGTAEPAWLPDAACRALLLEYEAEDPVGPALNADMAHW